MAYLRGKYQFDEAIQLAETFISSNPHLENDMEDFMVLRLQQFLAAEEKGNEDLGRVDKLALS